MSRMLQLNSKSKLSMRLRMMLIVAICLIVALVTIGVMAARTKNANANPSTPLPVNCTPPGITVATDATGDTGSALGTVPGTADQDLVSVSLAEPFQTDGVSRLAVTMKVASLDPSALAPSGIWRTYFKVGTVTWFVTVFNDPTAGVKYQFGQIDPTTGSNSTLGDADGGALSGTDKTLTVLVANTKVGSPLAGQTITGIYGRTQTLVGAQGTGATPTHDVAPDSAPTTGTGSYALIGNSACAPPATPTPTPTATPSGTPPPGDNCASQLTTLITDPSGDQTGAPQLTQLDVTSVAIAEDYHGADKLVFKMKVNNLSSIPANGVWRTNFTTGATIRYVSMNSDQNSTVTFEYGTQAGNFITPTGAPDSGSYTADGTITIILTDDKIGNLSAGSNLTNINGETQVFVGAAGTGLFQPVDSADSTPAGNIHYTLAGRSPFCPAATPTPTPVPTPAGAPGTPRYFNYAAPNGLATGSGEPSIGVNWQTGKVFFQAGLETDRISFDDCTSPAKATWEDKSAPTSQRTLDPLLYTDHNTGNHPNRTVVSQLAGTSSLSSYTDDDGETWLPDQGGGIASGVDHQTIGSGPFAAPLTRDPNGTLYPNAVYYCSQDLVDALCALSVDGGLTYGPAVPIYTTECGGIHGHVKVGPDGTVYVPNKDCGGKASVVVSKDNGTTWAVKSIPGSGFSGKLVDPSVGIGAGGTIYLGYQNSDGHARIAVSHNQGDSWSFDQDVGAALGLKNTVFPAVVAGDDDRAAFAFLGSTTPGDYTDTAYTGVWHLYIAHTFDGGEHWSTIDATPNDPVQRGSICTLGTLTCSRTPDDRNLLDFMDATVDKEGRMLIGYADGCIGSCVQGGANSFSALGTIARQSGGLRLFHANDPVEPAKPGAPLVTATRDNTGVHLTWSMPDNGGTGITNFKVYRRPEGSTQSTLIANVGTATAFDDQTTSQGTNYIYKVTAVNSAGESQLCDNAEVAPTGLPNSDPCNVPGVSVVTDPQNDAPLALDIEELSIAEPYQADGQSRLVFTLKMADLTVVPPNTQWYVIWNYGTGLRKYVAAKSDANSVVSYEYGEVGPPLPIPPPVPPDPNSNKPMPLGAADAGSMDAIRGTFTITIANSKIGGPSAGQTLTDISPRTFAGTGNTIVSVNTAVDSTASTPSYSLTGNYFCRAQTPPVALMTVTPETGAAPLTVNFDASASHDPDAGDTVASYTFDFGDANVVTQTTPTISHVYNTVGNYRAALIVKDSRGRANDNVEQAFINVTDGGPTPTPTPTPTPSPSPSPTPTQTHARPADFDGDAKSDLALWRPADGAWYSINSGDGAMRVKYNWGSTSLGDVIVPGDYDGDAKTDYAIFRQSEGNWYIINSSTDTITLNGWGTSGDRPVPGDYDGDGKTDVAIFRPSEGNWYIRQSSNGAVKLKGWGASDDLLVPGDYDGDGKTDVAVYRPSEGNWYIINSSTDTASRQNWGQPGDRPVPGDYDGDGKTDAAVFRPAEGNWYVKQSSGGATVKGWGASDDRPVPGDYDGDGKTDLAVWRPSEGTWYILKSSDGSIKMGYLNETNAVLVESAYIP